ncbi:hypothetical protein STAS_14298, partial [Striga asiatica]
MNHKNQQQPPMINRKLITLSLFFLFILYVLTRPDFHPIKTRHLYLPNPNTCNKLPLSVSESLVHYATSLNTTPQQTLGEISVTLRALHTKSPCNFLVFGLGHDSLLWATLNHNGRTLFLEDSKEWIAEVKKRAPSLEVRHVAYDTRVGQADELLLEKSGAECRVVGDPRSSKCQLALKDLPSEVYEAEWDLIMVDAPIGMPGWPESPGRMKAIYTAGLLARNRKEGETEVFVHDVDRHVEDSFSMAFLCEGYQKVEENRLRHFSIPSYGAKPNMKSKSQFPINPKTILICSFFLFLLFLILRSTSPNSPQQKPSIISQSNSLQQQQQQQEQQEQQNFPISPTDPLNLTPTCTKLPPSLANALVHYATQNITPQQTLNEISVSLKILEQKSPCNFLVFGLGHDSLMWASLNHNGRTVFLEEDKSWIEQIKKKVPSLESHHVVYNTKRTQAEELLETSTRDDCREVKDPRVSKCPLALKSFPNEIYEVEWDLIMVDAPTGYFDEAPGRMSAIYTAGLMARNRESGETDVFVHDVDRVVEDRFSKALLCEGYLREEEGRIRHFTIPSYRARSGRPFC